MTDAKTRPRSIPHPHPEAAGPRCTSCDGRGWVPHDDVPAAVCGICEGTGYPQSYAAQEIRRLDTEVARLRAAAGPAADEKREREKTLRQIRRAADAVIARIDACEPMKVLGADHYDLAALRRDVARGPALKAIPGMVTCEHCPAPHPLNDDNTPCRRPRQAYEGA